RRGSGRAAARRDASLAARVRTARARRPVRVSVHEPHSARTRPRLERGRDRGRAARRRRRLGRGVFARAAARARRAARGPCRQSGGGALRRRVGDVGAGRSPQRTTACRRIAARAAARGARRAREHRPFSRRPARDGQPRRRGRQRRACRAARRRDLLGRCGAARSRVRRPPARAVPARRRAAAARAAGRAAGRRSGRHALGLRPHGRGLGGAGEGRRGRARARGVASRRLRGHRPRHRPRGSVGRVSVYGSSHPAKRQSAALTDGVDRAPARAMLKGAGFTDADLARPLIGVATTWIETMPCNLNHRLLAGYVKQGIRRAGGTPLEFNTISVSDGVTMGTAGMRASLVSREVIADSIELVARGHLFDGIVCIVGCDKTIPAAVMALARLDLPGLVLYGGSIAPGRYRGRDVTIQDVFEVVGAHAAGAASDAEVHALESVACPGAGACGGQYTANTMATVLDFLGVSAPGLNEIPATHPGKPQAAVRAGELAMQLVESDTRPSRVLTREAFENAIAAIAATGGSTNGVLHLLAIAAEAGVELTIDDFDTISARTPIVADIKPGGRYVATDLFRAGGVALVARELVRAGVANEGATGVDGRTLGQVAAGAHERPGQDVVVSWDKPLKTSGGLAILRGNLAPDGCVVK